jgi:AcrR family transcriptional regulator
MAEKGRRPGNRDTRAEILAAAAAVFAEESYDRASLRSIAARAAVDPSLIHHYFPGGKPELFAEAVQQDFDPRLILDLVLGEDHVSQVAATTRGQTRGSAIVLHFLKMWDHADPSGTGDAFVSFTQAAASSPEAAAGVRSFLAERVWSHLDSEGRDPDDLAQRRSLVASQLMGLGFARYVLRLEPVASADAQQLAWLVGPTIDHYLDADLDPPKSSKPAAKPAKPAKR